MSPKAMALGISSNDHLREAQEKLCEAWREHLRAVAGLSKLSCYERYQRHVRTLIQAAEFRAHLRSYVQSGGDPAQEVSLRTDWRKLQRSLFGYSRMLEERCFLKKPRRS